MYVRPSSVSSLGRDNSRFQDVCSYNVDAHNLVTVVMKERDLDIQELMNYVGEWHRSLVDTFVSHCSDFPAGDWSSTIDDDV